MKVGAFYLIPEQQICGSCLAHEIELLLEHDAGVRDADHIAQKILELFYAQPADAPST